MRIGMFILSSAHGGGAFQQAFTTIRAARGQNDHELVYLTLSPELAKLIRAMGPETILLRYSMLQRGLDRLTATDFGVPIISLLRKIGLRNIGRRLDSLLEAHNIDIAVFSDQSLANCLSDHPYISTVWDVCHRDFPEFPEVSRDRQFEQRERLFHTTLPRAVAVIVELPSGARRIAQLYGVDPARIVELPLLPSVSVRQYLDEGRREPQDMRTKYRLPERFVFYPAQFWSHKNHVYLLEGLAELERRHGIVLDAVFCGTDKGNYEIVAAHARALGLSQRLHYLGFVPDEDIPPLYALAVALVMPTYFGPTNLPPLEAAAVGCVVVYSDFPEFREQMRDAALYCDLKNPASMANYLADLINDPACAERLRVASARLLADLYRVDYGARLGAVWDNFSELRQRWTKPR